jgi:peptidyl-prolyl cis-trans isomerase C
MMKMTRTLLSIAVTGILAGCAETADTVTQENWLGEATIGTINGEPVAESVFRRLSLDTIQKPVEEMTPEERSAMIDRLVTFEVAAAEAERLGLHQERNVAASLEIARLSLLANAVVERHLGDNPPSEAELRDLYEERIENLSGTEYKARHILVESEEEAVSLIEQLDGGADFAALAQEFSTGPTGPNGGDLGWFAPDRMVAPFSAAVQALEVGAFSAAPVQTQFGWHVILLEETRDQQPPGIESLRVELTTVAQQQRVQAYLEGLREAAAVEVE